MPEIKLYDVEFLPTALKAEGKMVTIKTAADKDPKFKSPAVCQVEAEDGNTYLFGFNKTTIGLIGSKVSRNSNDWVGKKLISLGEQKLGSMMGTPWDVVKL